MTHQIFIASYARDFEWLRHNLSSLHRFARGFLPPVIAVPRSDFSVAVVLAEQAHPGAVVVEQDSGPDREPWDRFLKAQRAMMTCDLVCTGDIVHLLGSDCFIKGLYTPDPFMREGKPVMLYNTYAEIEKCHAAACWWRRGTLHALGWMPQNEYMRRLPILYPREVYPAVRDFVSYRHGMSWESYVASRADAKDHSESNILGEYAHRFLPNLYYWDNIDGERYGSAMVDYPSPVIQFWSHGGLDHPCDCRYSYVGGSTFGKTPRQIMDEVYAGVPVPVSS